MLFVHPPSQLSWPGQHKYTYTHVAGVHALGAPAHVAGWKPIGKSRCNYARVFRSATPATASHRFYTSQSGKCDDSREASRTRLAQSQGIGWLDVMLVSFSLETTTTGHSLLTLIRSQANSSS